MEGKAEKQIQTLHSYLFSLAQLLSISLDSAEQQSQSAVDYQSPRAIFSSIRRLISSSTEIFDDFRQKLLPYLDEIYLSLESFRQFSTNQSEKFSQVEQNILDSKAELSSQIQSTKPEISQSGAWTMRKTDNLVELWGIADGVQREYALPVELEGAIVIPAGAVNGSTLSLPEGSSAIYITGKEKA